MATRGPAAPPGRSGRRRSPSRGGRHRNTAAAVTKARVARGRPRVATRARRRRRSSGAAAAWVSAVARSDKHFRRAPRDAARRGVARRRWWGLRGGADLSLGGEMVAAMTRVSRRTEGKGLPQKLPWRLTWWKASNLL